MDKRFFFITRVPDEPGSLQKAAAVITECHGNINRVHYDRRIDPSTVFFEVTAGEEMAEQITRRLRSLGFLQSSLPSPGVLKFSVHLPHRTGALHEFLDHTTAAGANIAFADFDDTGEPPHRLTFSMTLEDRAVADRLLDVLKSRYRIEVLESTDGRDALDDTVFYLRFAEALRSILGGGEETFLMRLLHDINHIVQELNRRGEDPKLVFESILATGQALKETCGTGFYADVQRVPLAGDLLLTCIQPPCGGNIYLLSAPGETFMVDSGYGIYHDDLLRTFSRLGIGDLRNLSAILVTHADADHCGGAGLFPAVSRLSPISLDCIRTRNRAFGSRSEGLILETVYTTVINLFSRFTPPEKVEVLPGSGTGEAGAFPVLARFMVGGHPFEILQGLDGHMAGQVYLVSRDLGVLFTGDSLINLEGLTPERRSFNSLAVNLITSVNVDRDLARREREGLLALAATWDADVQQAGRRCLVCGGHGPVSILEGSSLVTLGRVERLRP
ncbi:MAG: MBL fold metallo-hydrolase [Methanomicrobiales archaeon]|nr:MBL fold metallo-hydrolase [Methanomicrobiales archaeon]MDD1668609.1 MBL fold metallo-hydrolase [Methanomicrobiales archaeon]